MATKGINPVIWHLRRAVLLHDGAGLSDGKLLGMFIDQDDELAFEALMRRYGPMVHGVCRRILCNQHDAQDACQATFLVLVRRAKSVLAREMVGNWLYAVARQTAIRMQSQNYKRWRREKQVTVMPEPNAKTSEANDALLILDQELSRLPEMYRIAIILCDLDGKTRKQAARQLDWPEGTLGTRLARGRTMLAKRLTKRGVVLSVEALALALTQNLASASLPPTLVSTTVKAASLMAAGKTVATGLISAKVAALTEGAVKTMLLTKLKTMVAVLTVVGVLGLGIGAGTFSVSASADNQVESQKQGGQRKEKQVQAAQEKGGKPQKVAKVPPKEFTNNIGMKFVWIPPGSFMMGSPKEEKERHDEEVQHKVTLTEGFYMGVHLVTQEQWQAVVGNNPGIYRGEKNLPVEQVSWDDCQEFIKKLREKDKKEYRLPTEAEWEYSCRAGTTTPFYFGETISTDQANYNGEYSPYGNGKKGVFRKKTMPVGSFPANAFGLYDMHGNLWEWCQDWYGEYPQKDVIDPQGPDAGKERVLRGGSFFLQASNVRSANRANYMPAFRWLQNGFRVAMTYTADEAKQDTPPAKDAQEGQKQVDGSKEKLSKTKTQAGIEKRSGYLLLKQIDLAKGTMKGISVTNPEESIVTWLAELELLVTPMTKITIDGKVAQLADFQAVRLQNGYVESDSKKGILIVEWEQEVSKNPKYHSPKGKATRIAAMGIQVNGLVQNINASTHTITIKKMSATSKGGDIPPAAHPVTVPEPQPTRERGTLKERVAELDVVNEVEVIISGKAAGFNDLKPNMKVSMRMSAVKNLVLGITAYGPKVEGIVKSVDAEKNAISVNIPITQMTSEGVPVAKDAKVVIDGAVAKLSDLKAGMQVTLQMSALLDESLVVGITADKTAKKE